MKLLEFRDKLIDEIKKISSYEDLKHVDKSISIPILSAVFIGIIIFYFFLFGINPAVQDIKTEKAIEEAKKKEQSEKKFLYTDYGSMGSNPQNNSPAPKEVKPAKAAKIPANFMKVDEIPAAQKEIYFNAFDIIYDYLEQINAKNFGNALGYLDANFKKDNNITVDNLYNYTKNIYFDKNTFFIENVLAGQATDTVKLFIGNEAVTGVGFYIEYKITKTNGINKLIIEDLANYIKTNQ